MEKKPMDCYRALRIFNAVFYGGFLCLLLALMLGSGWAMYLLGTVGMIAVFGGLGFGFLTVRCPDCGKALIKGRVPGIPKFCPHCGKQLREEEA